MNGAGLVAPGQPLRTVSVSVAGIESQKQPVILSLLELLLEHKGAANVIRSTSGNNTPGQQATEIPLLELDMVLPYTGDAVIVAGQPVQPAPSWKKLNTLLPAQLK